MHIVGRFNLDDDDLKLSIVREHEDLGENFRRLYHKEYQSNPIITVGDDIF